MSNDSSDQSIMTLAARLRQSLRLATSSWRIAASIIALLLRRITYTAQSAAHNFLALHPSTIVWDAVV